MCSVIHWNGSWSPWSLEERQFVHSLKMTGRVETTHSVCLPIVDTMFSFECSLIACLSRWKAHWIPLSMFDQTNARLSCSTTVFLTGHRRVAFVVCLCSSNGSYSMADTIARHRPVLDDRLVRRRDRLCLSSRTSRTNVDDDWISASIDVRHRRDATAPI